MERRKIWKLFKLPSPLQLGMTGDSKYDALPMKMFQHRGDTTPTWEDWDARVKKDYPIRYFFAEQLWPGIQRLYQRYVRDAWYWIMCHVFQMWRTIKE